MAERTPIARSPVRQRPPVRVVEGWEVSAARSAAALRLADLTPVTKTLVRAPEDSAAAERLGCRFGQAVRGDRELVVGAGPDEWLILSPPGRRPALASGLPRSEPELVTVVDVTHAGVLLRLSGPNADQVLAKVCSIDLSDAVTPSGRAFRSSVARLACLVIRDDTETIRSYLIHGDRSSGQYLVDTLLGVGGELGIDMDGFPCGT